MKYFNFSILFEPRDLWIGIFWCVVTEWEVVYSATNYDPKKPSHYGTDVLKVYICIIPMFPLRISVFIHPFKAWLSGLLINAYSRTLHLLSRLKKSCRFRLAQLKRAFGSK